MIRYNPSISVDSPEYTLTRKSDGAKVYLSQDYWVRDAIAFRPQSVLGPSAEYTFAITGKGFSYQSKFTTGSGTDDKGPALVAVSPAPGTTGANPFGPFTFHFDQPLLYFLAGQGVSDGSGSFIQDVGVTLSADRTSVELRPLPTYGVPALVEMEFNPEQVRDLAGNSATGVIKARFATSVASDTRGPVLLGQYPDAKETQVPTDAVVQLLFSRPLNQSSVRPNGIVLEANGQALDFEAQVNGPLVHLGRVTLLPKTLYRVRITRQVLDADGFAAAQDTSFEFTTGAGPAPVSTEAVATGPVSPGPSPKNVQIVLRTTHRLPAFAPALFSQLSPARYVGYENDFRPLPASARLLEDRRTLVIVPKDALPSWSGWTIGFAGVTDICGQSVDSVTVSTTDQIDAVAPTLLATTPAEGSSDFPIKGTLSFALSEEAGLATAASGVRLTHNGDVIPGTLILNNRDYDAIASGRRMLEYRPDQPLQTNTQYALELSGVVDVAGNKMTPRTIHFKTAGDAATPNEYARVLRSNLDSGDLDPYQAIELETNYPVSAGRTLANVYFPIAGTQDTYTQPSTTTVSGTKIRVAPTLAWPSDTDLTLTVTSRDLWGREFSYWAYLHVKHSGDTTRPEVISVTPAPGTTIGPLQGIRLDFSEPMFNASQTGGGLVTRIGTTDVTRQVSWSDDRRSVTIVPGARYLSDVTGDGGLTVVASSTLTDLAGNRLKTSTARFPVTGQPGAAPLAGAPKVVATLPDRNRPTKLSQKAPVTLILSTPVDAALLNRAVWVLTMSGRMAGTWSVNAGGLVAVFQPQTTWPGDSWVRLLQTEPVLGLTFDLGLSTASAPTPARLKVLRTSLASVHPANAVIDVEFNQDVSTQNSPMVLDWAPSWGAYTPLEATVSSPRPHVHRITPKTPLTAGSHLRLSPRVANPDLGTYVFADVAAPLSTQAVTLRYRTPLPEAAGVPRNAHISVLFTASLNALSVNDSTVHVTAGGRPVLVSYSTDEDPFSPLRIIPTELFDANQFVQVSLEGLEDRLGRRIPAILWSFRTGSAIDLTAPKVLYSTLTEDSAFASYDANAPARVEYDEPIDPALLDQQFKNIDASMIWEPSADLRSFTFHPAHGWEHGKTYASFPYVQDWSGNSDSGNYRRSELSAGFEPDHSPLSLIVSSIRDGQTDVPLNAVFGLRFNKLLTTDALRFIRLTRGSVQLPLTLQYTGSDAAVRLVPGSWLDPNTKYELKIDGLADPAGNRLTKPVLIRLTTGERIDLSGLPAAVRFVSRTQPIRVRCAEPVDISQAVDNPGVLTWTDKQGNGYSHPVPVRIALSDDARELTVTPQQELRVGMQYQFSPGLSDLAGNPISASAQLTPAEVEDRTPPAVTIIPNDGSKNVPLNVIMQVWFSRTVETPPIHLFEEGSEIRIVASKRFGSVNVSGGSVFPQARLKPNRNYRLVVDAFRDAFDNLIPAATSSFKTGNTSDGSELELLSSNPKSGAAGVAPTTPLALTFSKPLSDLVYLWGTPTATRNIPFTVGRKTSGSLLTLTPSPAWPAASTISLVFFVYSPSGLPGVSDWAGNTLRWQTGVNFKTAAIHDPVPPVLESVKPKPGTTIPGGKAVIELHFSKPVMVDQDSLHVLYGTQQAQINSVFGADGKTLTLTLSPPANSRLTIIGTDAIRDNADNPIQPFSLEFPAGEQAPYGLPRMESSEPRNGAVDVASNAQIKVRFDRVMNSSSVIASIRVTQDGDLVSGSVAVLENGRAYQFRPDRAFNAGSTVRVFILPAACDQDGLAYGEANSQPVQFTVAGAKPKSLTVVRRGFLRTAPAEATLEAEFNVNLDPATVNENSVWLRNGGELVPGRASLREGRILQFTPATPLAPGLEYVLTAGSDLRGEGGQEYAGEDLSFRASPAEAAAEVEDVTETEWEGHAAIRVRFTRPVSPLAVHGFRLDADGRTVEADALATLDGREFILIPREAQTAGSLAVSVERVPDRSGRLLAPARVRVTGKGAAK